MAWSRMMLCVCAYLFVGQTDAALASYNTHNMSLSIKSLQQHYKSSETYNGISLFPLNLPTGKTETNMVYMAGVLQFYDTLISTMLDQLPTANPGGPQESPSIRKNLSLLQKKVRELKDALFEEQFKFLQKLKNIEQIPMKDNVVQCKALEELLLQYRMASELSNGVERQRRRRRRQTKAKKHL